MGAPLSSSETQWPSWGLRAPGGRGRRVKHRGRPGPARGTGSPWSQQPSRASRPRQPEEEEILEHEDRERLLVAQGQQAAQRQQGRVHQAAAQEAQETAATGATGPGPGSVADVELRRARVPARQRGEEVDREEQVNGAGARAAARGRPHQLHQREAVQQVQACARKRQEAAGGAIAAAAASPAGRGGARFADGPHQAVSSGAESMVRRKPVVPKGARSSMRSKDGRAQDAPWA